jgi:uncharacterized protein (TIGR02117 family)
MSRRRRIALKIGLGMASIPALIGMAFFGGAVIPADRAWQPPPTGVTIYVTTNGVHTGLILPSVNALHDWRGRVKAGDLAIPPRADTFLLFGWGERDFYLNTPRWSDIRIGPVLRAALGSNETLMHVEHLGQPVIGPDLRPIILTPAQYSALTQMIDGDFADGSTITGYGPGDVFYPAHGVYSAIWTCNEWTGAKLRAIGVRVGVWTPASWSVMRWFRP